MENSLCALMGFQTVPAVQSSSRVLRACGLAGELAVSLRSGLGDVAEWLLLDIPGGWLPRLAESVQPFFLLPAAGLAALCAMLAWLVHARGAAPPGLGC